MSEGFHYLATELIVGETLRERIAAARCRSPTAWRSPFRSPPPSAPPTPPESSTATSSPRT